MFLHLQMWCLYSCFKRTCSRQKSTCIYFNLFLSITFSMNSYLSFLKNGHQQLTYWIVLIFRRNSSCIKANNKAKKYVTKMFWDRLLCHQLMWSKKKNQATRLITWVLCKNRKWKTRPNSVLNVFQLLSID